MDTYQCLRRMSDVYLGISCLNKKTINEIANGCGPKGGFFGFDLVPDDFLGLDVSEACNYHDCNYHFGKTSEDKLIADLLFLMHMVILNHFDEGESKYTKAARYNIIMKYFTAVSMGGDDAFYKDKEST